jgi:hypothetical protein
MRIATWHYWTTRRGWVPVQKKQSRKAEEERLKGLVATTIDRLLALRVAVAAAAATAQGITN